MRRLTFENNRGERIVFYRSPYIIESLTGIGEVDATIQGQTSPYQDGETYVDTRIQPRFPTMEGSITSTYLNEIKEHRKEILRVCNPNLGLGKLILEMDGDLKEIPATLDNVPTFPERGDQPYQRFMIIWKCPDPYWRDPLEVSRELKAYEGTFTFSFTFPTQFGIESDTTTLMNTGHTKAPVRIEVKGPIRRPLIENLTTGKHIQINAIVNPDQTLIIDTKPTNKRVLIKQGDETRNVMGWFDQAGDFWELALGENEIRYRADAGVAEAVATIRWQNKYVGV